MCIYIHILDITSRIHIHIWRPPGRLNGRVWGGRMPPQESKFDRCGKLTPLQMSPVVSPVIFTICSTSLISQKKVPSNQGWQRTVFTEHEQVFKYLEQAFRHSEQMFRYMVTDTWYRVPGTKNLALYLVPGTGYQVAGTRHEVLASRYLVPDTRTSVQISRTPNTE